MAQRDGVGEGQGARGQGTLAAVGTDADAIIRETGRLLCDARAYERMRRAANPYGDGRAARRIVDFLAGVF